MKVAALCAPFIALGLMHVLQRLEAWALQDREATGTSRRTATSGPRGTSGPRVRQRAVSRRRSQGEASKHA
jgi:hypothetical protein